MGSTTNRAFLLYNFVLMKKDASGQEIERSSIYFAESPGMESIKKPTGTTYEAIKINKSLLCLKQILGKIVKGDSKFIPFRESIVTRLLEPNLVSPSKVVVLLNISPCKGSYSETYSLLKLGQDLKIGLDKLKASNSDKNKEEKPESIDFIKTS